MGLNTILNTLITDKKILLILMFFLLFNRFIGHRVLILKYLLVIQRLIVWKDSDLGNNEVAPMIFMVKYFKYAYIQYICKISLSSDFLSL